MIRTIMVVVLLIVMISENLPLEITTSPSLPTRSGGIKLPVSSWEQEAMLHEKELDRMLYPPGECLKTRQHTVKTHPIYNFLHTYYRYSAKNLRYYSPGIDVVMEAKKETSSSGSNSNSKRRKDLHISQLDPKYLHVLNDECCSYTLPPTATIEPTSPFGWITMSRNRDLLMNTDSRIPFFGCFGFHEWAMLYSGRNQGPLSQPLPSHQKEVPIRVTQEVIDDVVETMGLRCTHYDAYRFFHPSVQPLNSIHPLTRTNQIDHEQPGCVHTAMDLFKYAYQIYPFISSSLLRSCIHIALTARKLDMRASPYDTTNVLYCGPPICVETLEGRNQYQEEQKALALEAAIVREELIQGYNLVLSKLQ